MRLWSTRRQGSWSEQQRIESHGPQYLRNVIRIITETGLRVYKELTPMRKNQLDLQNARGSSHFARH